MGAEAVLSVFCEDMVVRVSVSGILIPFVGLGQFPLRIFILHASATQQHTKLQKQSAADDGGAEFFQTAMTAFPVLRKQSRLHDNCASFSVFDAVHPQHGVSVCHPESLLSEFSAQVQYPKRKTHSSYRLQMGRMWADGAVCTRAQTS